MRYKKTSRKQKQSIYQFIVAMVFGAMLAVGGSVWATTIGNNVSVGGTLTSTGNVSANADLTVTSGARVGADTAATHFTALADDSLFGEGQLEIEGIAWFDGTLHASSTLLVGGAATFYGAATVNGNVTIGDASTDTLIVTANSITYSNAGTTTIPSTNANAWAYATSSANIPVLKLDTQSTNGPRVGISTTTPGATLAVGGNGMAIIMGGATSTLSIQSTGGSNKGGCIELETTVGDGTVVSLMSTSSGNTVYFTAGGCR